MSINVANIQLPDLPEGYTPLETVAVIKCLDASGSPTLAIRVSDSLMGWEAVGMLISACDMARSEVQSDFTILRDNDELEGEDEDDV
jgi:hypothetical protein